MTIFKPFGGGTVIQDKEAIQNITKVLDTTQGFNIVHENGACVLGSKTAERTVRAASDQNDRLQRVWSHAANQHEMQRNFATTCETHEQKARTDGARTIALPLQNVARDLWGAKSTNRH